MKNNKVKILLIGQPNVGKSSLLNSLVGPKVVISNYPGTTVELTKARKVFQDKEIVFIDTPGIYSISDRSEEEKVTERALFEGDAKRVIVLADATSLERSLYMVLQVLEAGIPVIVALNFVEEAQQKGIQINRKKLSQLLQVPVVSINPLTGKGLDELLRQITRTKEAEEAFEVEYDDHIEQAIDKISSEVESNLPGRFVAVRILEEDYHFYKYLTNEKVVESTKRDLEQHPNVAKDISVTRYGTASFIAEKVTDIDVLSKGRKLQDKIDRFLLDKTWGPIITGSSLLLTFGFLLKLGNFTQNLLMNWTEKLFLLNKTSSLFFVILNQGLTGLAAGVSIALPYVFLFYLLLGFLEDMGVLSRFIVNAERFLKKIGLPGKSFIPLALGLGCTAPATRATRVLSSKKEQFHAASMFTFIPCSSRIAIIMGVVGFYGGFWPAFSVFISLFFGGLIWAFATNKVLGTKSEPLLLELPPYRKPLLKNILTKSWIRMKDFVYIVMPLLAAGGVFYGVLNRWGMTNNIVEPLSFIARWLKLPKETVIPLTLGFIQKDLTGAMLISVLGTKISSVLSSLQLYIFGLASTMGIPCVIAFGMLWKEFGFKKSFGLTLASVTYGFLFAGLMLRIILLFY